MATIRPATIEDAAEFHRLVERSAASDGYPGLSEFKYLRAPVANGARTLVLSVADGAICGAGVAAWHPTDIGEAGGYWAAELLLDPEGRSEAAYGELLEALTKDLGVSPALWTFDDQQAQAAFAHGLVERRAVVEMRRPLPAPPAHLPDPYELRGFVPGRDEADWLALNHRVFAHHPEAGAIDAADLALRMAQPWFDPDGLLILGDGADDGDGWGGYCWTKIHSGGVGEIYMIGLVPEHRGRGLARPLTLAGLEYLHAHGATTAMLYAEESNAAAVALYASMGFGVERRVTLYQPPN